jgi:two-component system response regulator HydG
MERAVVFARTAEITVEDLPAHLAQFQASGAVSALSPGGAISIPLGASLKEVEELLIRKTLEATSGDKNMAAKLLGINSRTIYRKLDQREPD